ncbi:hypothetical protein OAD81_04405, partial [Flavobacteriaceae bacterium]|nr:hypothetical protein [Flavobacteriaceae bacterium]
LIVSNLIFFIDDITSIIAGRHYENVALKFAVPFSNISLILLGISLLIEKKLPAVSKNIERISDEVNLNSNDVPSSGLNIISFLIPLVGLIIYLTEKDKAPKKANAAGKAALWGTGISISLYVISVIVSIAMISNKSYF